MEGKIWRRGWRTNVTNMLKEVIQGLLMNPMFQHKPNCLLRPCLHGLLILHFIRLSHVNHLYQYLPYQKFQ